MTAVFYLDVESAKTGLCINLKTIVIDGKTYVYNRFNESGDIPRGIKTCGWFEGPYLKYKEICATIQKLPDEMNVFLKYKWNAWKNVPLKATYTVERVQ